MNRAIQDLIFRLHEQHSLTLSEYERLIEERDEQSAALLRELAGRTKQEIYENHVYLRGLIECSNICRNDCFYCGIRRSNKKVERYHLTEEDILECCKEGYALGFRTFVLQGGEDAYYTDAVLESIIRSIKAGYPDCALTLSLGERTYESYRRLYSAGADRYLLRHETATREHYERLHPKQMSFANRMSCLRALKEIGFQVGCGFMVGSPYQTNAHLARDLKFIEEFQPDMCGIGPFIPHGETPFGKEKTGTLELTTYLLSILRLIKPNLLLPSTTALGTIDRQGRELGILAGANVVMPNLSPITVRKKYELYDNKICTGDEAAQCRACLERRIQGIGHVIRNVRGDVKKAPEPKSEREVY